MSTRIGAWDVASVAHALELYAFVEGERHTLDDRYWSFCGKTPELAPAKADEVFWRHHGRTRDLLTSLRDQLADYVARHTLDSLVDACPSLRAWLPLAVRSTDPLTRAAALELAGLEYALQGDQVAAADRRAKAEAARQAVPVAPAPSPSACVAA